MEKLIVNNYGSFDVTFTHGKGATMWDSTGKKYIDFIAGIGVNALGHNYKPLVKAINRQIKKQIHVSNYYFSDTGITFAKELLRVTGYTNGYFANSGAEANEAAIKLARKYGYLHGGQNRKTIISLQDSFHGRTLATLTATGQDVFHPETFAPYPQGFKTIRANNFEDIKNAFDDTVAAVLIEPLQGEGGVNLIDPIWAQELSKTAHQVGALVMADEVQTGIGRTGTFLASDALGLNADVVTLAKGIAGGIPMGACLFRNNAMDVFQNGDHQSTFAGNPLACAAGLTVLQTITAPGFMDRVNHAGDFIRGKISSWNLPIITDVRGKGLMIGVQLESKIKTLDVKIKCLEKGLCVTTAGKDVVRFLPPLVISDKEIEEGLEIFKDVLENFKC